ncbi:WD40-like domain containing protein, partial [uncultured Bacteroides sp.]
YYELPEGLRAEQFGDYPGVVANDGVVLLSAKTGEGRWTPVLYHRLSGFHMQEAVEAEALIPFFFSVPLPAAEGGKPESVRMTGYVVSAPADEGGSRFYLRGDHVNEGLWAQEPFAVWQDKVVSVSHRFDRPGTFTVLSEKDGTYTVADYDRNQNKWETPVCSVADVSYSAIAWGN